MLVKELVSKLQKCNQELEVRILDCTDGLDEDSIAIDDAFEDVDDFDEQGNGIKCVMITFE